MTDLDSLKKLVRENGYLYTKDVTNAGIRREQLKKYLDEGNLIRESRGIYSFADSIKFAHILNGFIVPDFCGFIHVTSGWKILFLCLGLFPAPAGLSDSVSRIPDSMNKHELHSILQSDVHPKRLLETQ